MNEYGTRLEQNVDPVTAASEAFGDLQKLQADLNAYLQGLAFLQVKLPTTTEVDDSAFRMRPLTATQSGALRAGFLAYNSRTSAAQALLEQVLQEDPKNVSERVAERALRLSRVRLDPEYEGKATRPACGELLRDRLYNPRFPAQRRSRPGKDLENRPAKVEYVESAHPSITPQLVSVELHK
jgi:hypothetical protein